ncbi:MAG: hypothetical protein KKD44_13975 [Proteobacteria bacterium]|nr:hypothetical protein [Pseudomonadota bacterium]
MIVLYSDHFHHAFCASVRGLLFGCGYAAVPFSEPMDRVVKNNVVVEKDMIYIR